MGYSNVKDFETTKVIIRRDFSIEFRLDKS